MAAAADLLVSVVVSTHDRPQLLGRLLAGLRAQSIGEGAFEVIVVDDGSAHDTQALLAAEQERSGLRLRTVRHEVSLGPGAGRNAGWRLAEAPLVAFTDDDCVPTHGWLQAGLQRSEEVPGAIIQGRTEPDPGALHHRGLLTRTVSVRKLGPQYETCNIFYPRTMLESLGGFDEAFGLRPGGEDTDLAWRALERGHEAAFSADAVVFHAVQPLGFFGTLRGATRWTASVRLFAQHRGIRLMLYRGLFWNVWHYLLVRSALVLLGPHWLRRLILVRHLLALRSRGREAGAGAWSVPVLLIYDVIETAAVLRGALRYRTPVI